MKKIAVFLLLFIGGALFASEAEVKRLHTAYLESISELDFNKALLMLHPSYVEIDSEGKQVTVADLKKMNQLAQQMKKITVPGIGLADLMEFFAASQGQPFTAEQRRDCEALEKTEKGKEIVKQIPEFQATVKAELNKLRQNIKTACQSYKVISCKVDGDKAELKYLMKEVDRDELNEYTVELIKVNGKWLFIKNVEKKIR